MSYIENLFTLQSRVAIVTGGTGVLGSAMCKALANAGAAVVILGRRKDAADQLAQEIGTKGGIAMGISADVLNKDQLIEARQSVLKKFGRIDILVNGAGGNMPGAVVMPDKTIFDLSIDDFKSVVDLNLTGSLLPTQIFGEPLAESKQGVIINISSMTAIRPLTRVLGYGAAKAAISNFTQWLAVEMAKKFGEGIRVNAIAPGFFLTEQNRNLLTNKDGSLTERGQLIIRGTPFGRFGEPDELSGTLLWLCSDASKFVSGIVVPVDGAFSAYGGV
ncbi:MAG: short-chain dehydrogenase/reductase SDR [Bacteroidetes bacterium OLB12]|nr:MAG: short-chain dehydrogenase/reductase SDR [Bacteroidetes bacterium OLB12]